MKTLAEYYIVWLDDVNLMHLEVGLTQKGWNKRGHSRIWTMKSNVFFKYFKHSWAQKETPVSGFQQRHSMVIVYM
jgi:hypothetical protein